MNHRFRRRQQARHLDFFADDHAVVDRFDLVYPGRALVHLRIQALALLFAVETADPDVDVRVFLGDEAAHHHHPQRDLVAVSYTHLTLPTNREVYTSVGAAP